MLELENVKKKIKDPVNMFTERKIKSYLRNHFVQKDNANARKSFSGLVNSVSQAFMKENVLSEMSKKLPEVVAAHEAGLIHVHDLWTSRFCGYCTGWRRKLS